MDKLSDVLFHIIGYCGIDVSCVACISRTFTIGVQHFFDTHSLHNFHDYHMALRQQRYIRESLSASMGFNGNIQRHMIQSITQNARNNVTLLYPPLCIPNARMYDCHQLLNHFILTKQRYQLYRMAERCVWHRGKHALRLLRKTFELSSIYRSCQDNLGRTLLFHCTTVPVAKLLMETRYPVAVNHCDKLGRTALHYMIRSHNIQLVRYVLSYGADPTIGTHELPIHHCNNLAMMRLVFPSTIACRPRLNLPKLLTWLISEKQSQACCHWLLDTWSQMKSRKRTYYRCPVTHETVLHKILKPQMFHRLQRFRDTTELLEVQDRLFMTPLLTAASNIKHWRVIPALLAAGANANARGPDGTTALHCIFGRPVQVYTRPVANINQRLKKKRLRIVQCLLHHHADVNAQDDSGFSVLHRCRDEASMRILLHWGADPLVRDLNQRTLLFYCGTRLICKHILNRVSSPAFLGVRDVYGYTALEHATRMYRTSVVRCLIEHGAILQHRGCFVRWSCEYEYRLIVMEHALATGRFKLSKEQRQWLAQIVTYENKSVMRYATQRKLLNVLGCIEHGLKETMEAMSDTLECLHRERAIATILG